MVEKPEMKKSSDLRRYKTPLLVFFSFLMGWMLSTNLTPIDKTCRIEDSDKEYNIMKNSKLKNPEIIVLIFSAPRNLDKRNAIRTTWLRLQDITEVKKASFRSKHYFVIGSLGLTTDEVLHLSSEQSQYSDILLLPMHDSYQNLTLKVRKSFEWLNEQFEYGLGFKYVLKCDDDSFVRLDTLPRELLNLELLYLKSEMKQALTLVKAASSPFFRANVQMNGNNLTTNNLMLYWGYFSGNARIKRTNKWKETEWIACDRYVPYALGGGYILSKNLITYIAKNSENLRNYNSEDVSVGLWLAPVNNVLRIHDIRFDTEWTSRGCQNTYLITHNISINEMTSLYDNVVKSNKLCKNEVSKRNFYLYNWSKPPSQCCDNKVNL